MATASTVCSLPQLSGMRSSVTVAPVQSLAFAKPSRRGGSGAIGARMDFIGSPANLIMVTSTSLMLFAGRFGLAPSANRMTTAGLKLVPREGGMESNDPAGFTLADTAACGAVGHIMGVGIYFGLKYLGVV